MAEKQSIAGICFNAVSQLPREQRPPVELYMNWLALTASIVQTNEMMDKRTAETLRYFRERGIPCQVLKGQGIAQLYGELGTMRQSGDIDVWVGGGRKRLYALSKKETGELKGLTYHHIHYPLFEDVEVEAHVWPSFLSSPLRNHRLHRFCKVYEPTEGCADTPPLSFNRIFILLHGYQHFSGHGVGLRQLMDYYFVLKQSFTEGEREESMRWISKLGMKRYVAALMWLCWEVFGLEDKYLLCKPDKTDGRFMLDEVLQTGNMGHSDERTDRRMLQTAGGRFAFNLKRDIHLMRLCPHETLWEPWFGIYQYTCRKLRIWEK